jgi:PAS domain S-box-containing protein
MRIPRLLDSLTLKIASFLVLGEVFGVIIFMIAHNHGHTTEDPTLTTILGVFLVVSSSLIVAVITVRVLMQARTAELLAAQVALQQSEALYREIVRNAQDVIVHVGVDGSIMYTSPAIETVLGYLPGAFHDDPTLAPRSIHAQSQAVFAAFWEQFHASGVFPETTLTLAWITADGREVWLEHRITNLRDVHGTVIGFQSIGRDITARRQAEHELRAERDLLNAILATSVQGITVLDPHGQIIFANERAETVLGLTRTDLTSRTYDASEWQTTALDGSPWPDDAQPFQRVLRSGEPVFEVQHAIVANDGRRRMLAINGAPIKDADDQITSLVFSVTDITEQKRAETALRTSEERFRELVNSMGVGVTLHDSTGRIIMANPAACAILGYSEAELTRPDFAPPDWNPVDEDGKYIPPQQRPVSQARLGLQPVYNQVVGIRQKHTGPFIWLLMNATPQFTPSGELRAIVCNFSDITAQRRLEAQLRQAQKLEAVGRLAGGVAHDLNNLLTVISGTSDLLLSDPALTPEMHQDVEQIQQASRRAADLTCQLLAFSRQQVLQPTVLDVNATLHDLLRMLRRLIGEDVQIDLQLADALWPIRVDPTQIEQVVLNLAINARDAMPTGGTLTICTTNVTIRANTPLADLVPHPGDYICLMVQDTGSGICPELQPYIFEPFFTTKESGRGTGLGLATVHGIVTQSGGGISFTSDLDAGSCFMVYLPRTELVVVAGDDPVPTTLQGGHETILVVEDEAPVRALIERVLRRQGYQVLVAVDGVAAQRLVATYTGLIDLLLTDVIMPGGVNGDQLALDVRRTHPQIRVLMMSGYAHALVGAAGANTLADSFLQKPFTPQTLVQRVRSLLDVEPHHLARSRAREPIPQGER